MINFGESSVAAFEKYKRRCALSLRTCVGLIGMVYAVHTQAQTVSVSVKQKNVKEVLTNLEKQAGVNFAYDATVLKGLPQVNLQFKDQSLEVVLRQLASQTGLRFKREGKLIGISKAATAPKSVATRSVAKVDTLRTLVGTVVDDSGAVIPGVTVRIERTNQVVTTNTRGQFQAEQVHTGDVLHVSAIGYNTERRVVNQGVFSKVILHAATSSLDEVVVQAYGQTSQRLTTSNISRVTAKEIEIQPVMDPLLTLQGKVPGLVITPQSGYDGGPLQVEIRGRGAVNNGFTSDPLYVIDGVPQTVLDIAGVDPVANGGVGSVSRGGDQARMSFAGGQSPLMNLNTADIESIEVLKDADATAIYGSRGANGVILITTKKGKKGKMSLGANIGQGVSFVSKYWDFLNTEQYIAMREEAFRNDGITPTAANAGDILLWDRSRYTDWQKFAAGGIGKYTDIQANLSGGSDLTSYRISAGLRNSTDISQVSGGNKLGSATVNLTNRSADGKFNMNLSAGYNMSVANQISLSATNIIPPNAPAVYDDNGNLNYDAWRASGQYFRFASLLQPYEGRTHKLNASTMLSYEIIKGLTLRTSLGYTRENGDQERYTPIASLDPLGSGGHPTGRASFAKSAKDNWIVEPQLEYNNVLGPGRLNVLLGGTVQKTSSEAFRIDGSGFTSDDLLSAIANAPVLTSSNIEGQYAYAGVFARINYNFRDKYILNLNGRRDGSSRFGPGNQFGNFGSLGAAWIASEENWLRDALPSLISLVKFRGSFGLTGSDAVNDYQFLSQWGSVDPNNPNARPQRPYDGVNTLVPLNAGNPNFHWQVNKKSELALDLGFWHDRINFGAAYYQNVTDNQLISMAIPYLTGFNLVTANSPAKVQNSGYEFQVSANLIDKPDFSWNMNVNLSLNRNKLLDYPDLEHSAYADQYRIGASLNIAHLYQYTGVDPLTGQYTFVDYNADGVVHSVNNVYPGTGGDDRYVEMDMNPKYVGGIFNSIRYKSVSLTMQFDFKNQKGRNQLSTHAGTMENIPLEQFQNHWQYPGQQAKYARFTTLPQDSDRFYAQSTGAYADASFIRLRTIALSYSLPDHWIRRIGAKSIAINLNAQNLFVLTNYKGIDPEVQGLSGMPPVRRITGGLSCMF